MSADPLSLVFAALADPTRRAILARLTEGAATVTQLVEPFAISQPAISKHLKVLERAGLITRNKAGQFRSSHLRADALDQALDWISYWRGVWDARFARLDAHLDRLTAEAPTPRKATT